MPRIIVPETKDSKITKPSAGDIFGTLVATKNIDLRKDPGKIRLSERVKVVANSTTLANLKTPGGLIYTNAFTAGGASYVWAMLTQTGPVTGGRIFTSGAIDSGWAQDATASTPTSCVSNIVKFGKGSSTDRVVVALQGNLGMISDGTWNATWLTTLSGSGFVNTSHHHINTFLNLLLLPDGNLVHTVDDSLVTVRNRLTIPEEFEILWIENDGRRVYFGTYNKRGKEALVFPWDGTSDTYDTPISVYDSVSFAGKEKGGIMYTINGKGQLLYYNGSAFEQIAALPSLNSELSTQDGFSNPRWAVHPNGMDVIDGELCFLWRAGLGSSTKTSYNFPNGIWALDERTQSLYNKYTIGQYSGTDNDWGGYLLERGGMLRALDKSQTYSFAVGARVYTDYNTNLYTLQLPQGQSSVNNRGFFITSKLRGKAIRMFSKRLSLIINKLKNSTDRIIVKYRTTDNYKVDDVTNNFLTVTFTDTDTITSTDAYCANISVGDEIKFTAGKGAGASAHVSSIVLAGGTYTIELDEAIPNASGTSYAMFTNFKKLKTISSQTIQNAIMSIAKISTWIQFEVELRGDYESPEIERLVLDFNEKQR